MTSTLYDQYTESERRYAAAERERIALDIPDAVEMARLMRYAKPRPGDTMEAFYRDLAEIETLHKTLFRTDQQHRERGAHVPAQLARAWRKIDALYSCDMGARYAAILSAGYAATLQPALFTE